MARFPPSARARFTCAQALRHTKQTLPGQWGLALLIRGPNAVFRVRVPGQVATGAIGTDAFQEADVMGISRPARRHASVIRYH